MHPAYGLTLPANTIVHSRYPTIKVCRGEKRDHRHCLNTVVWRFITKTTNRRSRLKIQCYNTRQLLYQLCSLVWAVKCARFLCLQHFVKCKSY